MQEDGEQVDIKAIIDSGAPTTIAGVNWLELFKKTYGSDGVEIIPTKKRRVQIWTK